MKKYQSAPTAAVSSTGATILISRPGRRRRLRRPNAALGLAFFLALGLAWPEALKAASPPPPGAALVKALAPLLGQPFRVDGAQDEEGRWVTFNRPDEISSAPGFNCSGFTVAAARLLLARPFSLAEATRDRRGDSGPASPLGPDWDFGLDLILNLSEGRALRTLPETPFSLLPPGRTADIPDPEFEDSPPLESPGPGRGAADLPDPEFENSPAAEPPGPGRGAADLPDLEFENPPAVASPGPGREAADLPDPEFENSPAAEPPGPGRGAADLPDLEFENPPAVASPGPGRGAADLPDLEFENPPPLEPLGPGRAQGWGVDLHSPEFENLLAQIRPGNFAFFCFSRPDGRFPAGVSYYHVGLILPEPPHLWLYHSTLGAATHRVDLAAPGRLARFRRQFPPPALGERRVLMIEVEPPGTD